MLLALGPHRFDITHQAIVLGVVSGSRDHLAEADALIRAGADALELAAPTADTGDRDGAETDQLVARVSDLADRFDRPISVRTASAETVSACFDAGAVVGHDPSGAVDVAYLRAAVDAGASLIVTGGAETIRTRASEVASAGLARDRIVVTDGIDLASSPPPGGGAAASGTGAGWPVLVSTVDIRADDEDHVQTVNAVLTLALMQGARIVRTRHARSARRIVHVTACLLEARASLVHLPEAS